jgi:hypothetical protein
MQLPLRDLSDRQTAQLHSAAQASLSAFVKATKQHGSLIQSWVRGAAVTALDHYPKGDVIDRSNGSQLFYHCHREGDVEHGHVHLFCHATRSGRRRYLSQQSARTAPSHLLALGLDARGLPISLFTVNRWVTDGHWFDAPTTLRLLQRFKMQRVKNHARSCDWVSGFVRMYEPLIEKLLHKRDQRLARAGPLEEALDNQRIEILSSIELDWAADLARLEHEMSRRGLK